MLKATGLTNHGRPTILFPRMVFGNTMLHLCAVLQPAGCATPRSGSAMRMMVMTMMVIMVVLMMMLMMVMDGDDVCVCVCVMKGIP